MTEPRKFSKRKDELCPVEWFKEPYSLLEAMLCGIYGLPNCSFFKQEWAPIAHHIINIGESFPWASILSLKLKNAIQEFQKATAKKKPNFYLTAFIVDVFCADFHYPNCNIPNPPTGEEDATIPLTIRATSAMNMYIHKN